MFEDASSFGKSLYSWNVSNIDTKGIFDGSKCSIKDCLDYKDEFTSAPSNKVSTSAPSNKTIPSSLPTNKINIKSGKMKKSTKPKSQNYQKAPKAPKEPKTPKALTADKNSKDTRGSYKLSKRPKKKELKNGKYRDSKYE